MKLFWMKFSVLLGARRSLEINTVYMFYSDSVYFCYGGNEWNSLYVNISDVYTSAQNSKAIYS